MWVRDFPHHECQKILSKSRGEASWFGRNFLAQMVRKIPYSHFRSHSNHIVENYKQLNTRQIYGNSTITTVVISQKNSYNQKNLIFEKLCIFNNIHIFDNVCIFQKKFFKFFFQKFLLNFFFLKFFFIIFSKVKTFSKKIEKIKKKIFLKKIVKSRQSDE